MTDAPERIWAGVLTDEYRGMTGTRIRVWGDDPRVGTDDPAIEYVRADLVAALKAENQRLREALSWYGEQARLARLIHREGDAGRRNLEADGGSRARALLLATLQAYRNKMESN